MYPAIIAIILAVGSWCLFRQEQTIRALRDERHRFREELISHAESETARYEDLDKIIRQLRSANGDLEQALRDKSARISERDREVEMLTKENEALCMKLARAVWQNGNGEPRSPSSQSDPPALY